MHGILISFWKKEIPESKGMHNNETARDNNFKKRTIAGNLVMSSGN